MLEPVPRHGRGFKVMLRLLLDWGRPKPSHTQRSFLVAGKFQKQRGAQHGAATKTKVKEAATGKSLSDLHGMLRPPKGDLVFYQRGDERQPSIILCAFQKEAQLF